jgi:hypothetical protein
MQNYLVVIFAVRMKWIAAEALRTYINTYSIFKSEHLSTNIKLLLYKQLAVYSGSYSDCRTELSHALAILPEAHWSANCKYLLHSHVKGKILPVLN